jgi:hypothetical protein
MRKLFCIVLGAGLCFAQAAAPSKEGRNEPRNLPPRATPADYQAQAKAGSVIVAADFGGHGVPTSDGIYSTEDYIIVEVGLFGPAGSKLNVSYRDFSLRINGKKQAQPAQPYEGAFGSLKDPEWVPPVAPEKSKTSLGGGGNPGDPPPAAPKMPMELRLAMEQKVKKAAIPDGERALPMAGLLFFQHGGKTSGLKSIELVYDGAAGKCSLKLPN